MLLSQNESLELRLVEDGYPENFIQPSPPVQVNSVSHQARQTQSMLKSEFAAYQPFVFPSMPCMYTMK